MITQAMTPNELKIFRLKDAIHVAKWHLNFEQHPTRYSLPKSTEDRELAIQLLNNRIGKMENELAELETRNPQPATI